MGYNGNITIFLMIDWNIQWATDQGQTSTENPPPPWCNDTGWRGASLSNASWLSWGMGWGIVEVWLCPYQGIPQCFAVWTINYFASSDPRHGIPSDILSGISSGILPGFLFDILSGISSGILSVTFWHSIWHSLWHSIWLCFWPLRSGWGLARPAARRISPLEVRRGPQCSESRLEVRRGPQRSDSCRLRSGEAHSAQTLSGWGPAKPSAIESWQWRRGKAHGDQELADEARRGPQRSRAGRGGLARPTAIESWQLRSGEAHCNEVRRGRRRRRRRRRRASSLKIQQPSPGRRGKIPLLMGQQKGYTKLVSWR